jgi:hypothetical protein
MNMDLVKRYLQAVRSELPRRQRDDIVAELSDTIQSRLEEMTASFGRPLTADDESVVLKQLGHPVLVAGRYRQQQYLIGPALYPYYCSALQRVLGLVLLLSVLGALAQLAVGEGGSRWREAAARIPYTMLFLAGTVTAVFAVVERLPKKIDLLADWKPESLPQAVKDRPVSRLGSVFEIVFGLFFISWCLKAAWARALVGYLLLGPARDAMRIPIHLSPGWHDYVPVVVLASALSVVQSAINFVRPDWTALRRVTRVAVNATWIGVVCFVARMDTFVTASDPLAAPAVPSVNQLIHAALWVAGLIAAADLYKNARELFAD